MSRMIHSDAMERFALEQYTTQLISILSPRIRLFVNNITPSETTVVADLTECSASWYGGPISLAPGGTVTTVGGTAQRVWDAIEYDYSGADPDTLIYGYWLDTAVDPSYFIIKRFDDAPRILGAATGPMWVIPAIGLLTAPS